MGTRGQSKYSYNYFDEREVYNYDGEEIYDFTNREVDSFKLVSDFEILLVDNECDLLGFHIKYYSNELGILVDFPWWDHADVDIERYELTDIPIGPSEDPFEESDEGWQIITFAKEGFINILIGSNPSFSKEFHTCFKVSYDAYLEQWGNLINFLKNRRN